MGFAPAGTVSAGPKRPQLPVICWRSFLRWSFFSRAVFGDGLFEHLAGLVVLAAVEEDLNEGVAGWSEPIDDRAVKCDKMIVGREFEAADAIGGFGEAFVLGEGVHFEDSLGAVRILLLPPTIGGESFHAELGLGKPGEFECDVGRCFRIEPGLLGECETPALAIVFRRLP